MQTQSTESTLDKSFEDLVTKILATEDDCPSSDNLTQQLTLTQELLDNLAMGNCFENGIPPWKQASVPDVSGMSSAQLIQEALAFMRQNKNLQDSLQSGGLPMPSVYPQHIQNGHGEGDFCKAPLSTIVNTQGEEESLYSGMGSPRNSVTGSYSSGDEVGWPNMAFTKEDPEVVSSHGLNRNSPQLANQYNDFKLDNHPLLNMKPTQPSFDSQPQFGSLMSSREDLGSSMASNRSSPNAMMAENVGTFPNFKPQQPGGISNFRNLNNNNSSGSLGRSSPRPMDPHSTNGYQTNFPHSQQPTDHGPYMPGPTFNYQRGGQPARYQQQGPQWKTQQQQGFPPRYNNQQYKVDAHIAGFPRNGYHNRYPYNGRNQAPVWMKRNQYPNMGYQQQRGSFMGGNSMCGSPVMSSIPPGMLGELSTAIRECQDELQTLERERRKTETDLVRMNPGKRISSSNTIAVPQLPPNPSSMDQLITEEHKEHSRMTTLLSKIGGLNARALHPNIEMSLDRWMSAIQAIEAYRTAEICQNGKTRQITGDGPVTDKVQELIKATSQARTKLWCALQLSKEKHIPPIQKEILNFVPEGVRVV